MKSNLTPSIMRRGNCNENGIATGIHLFCLLVAIIGLNSSSGSRLDQAKMKEDKHLLKLNISRGISVGGVCTKWDISISQSRYPSSGIPQYIVEIVNTCVAGAGSCAPSNIHVHCGWFASARMVNPREFKRVSYDDCLVNGGMELKKGQSIRFTYANSFMYPLFFKSATFC